MNVDAMTIELWQTGAMWLFAIALVFLFTWWLTIEVEDAIRAFRRWRRRPKLPRMYARRTRPRRRYPCKCQRKAKVAA